MKTSGLVKLSVITLVVVAAAWAFSDRSPRGQGAETGSESSRRWLDGLQERVNDVTRVKLMADGKPLTLVRDGDTWTLKEWGGYPVAFDKLVGTVMGLSELTVVGPKTARPENHAALQLEDPGGPDAKSLRITLEDASGSVLADVIVGKTKGTKGLFARRAGEDQTWELRGSLSPPREAAGWVDKQLLRVQADQMQRVSVTPPGEAGFSIVKQESGNWVLDPAPEGRATLASAPFSSLAGALAYLDLESVATDEQIPASAAWTTTHFEAKDGLIVDVKTAEAEDGKAYARLLFTAGEPLVDPAADLLAAAAAEQASQAGSSETDVGDTTQDESAALAGDGAHDGETADEAADSHAADDASAGEATDGEASDAETRPGADQESDADAHAQAADAEAKAAETQAKAEAARQAAAQALADKVADDTRRLSPWTYVIPSWKATALRKDIEDFLEPLPEVGPNAPEDDAVAPGEPAPTGTGGGGEQPAAGG